MALHKKSQILGAKELNAVLKALPDDLAKNTLSSVVLAGAKVVQKSGWAYLSINMPRTARLDDVIIRRRRTTGRLAVADVGPPRNRPDLRWLHFGTKEHAVTAINAGGPSEVLAARGEVFGAAVRHPGTRATFWLLRAFTAAKTRAIKAMAENMKKSLPRQVAKLHSKKYRNAKLKGIIRNARRF